MKFVVDNTFPPEHILVYFVCDFTRPQPKKAKCETGKLSSAVLTRNYQYSHELFTSEANARRWRWRDELISDYNARWSNLLGEISVRRETKVLQEKPVKLQVKCYNRNQSITRETKA
ncbi:hypothetical protein SNE40_007580 [Patella caerulea]|uniref:Uncharacterized protein n=1 Tax=Patella caerulea TaxID=87958 RepID=A0AAN8JY76_PATCE